MSFSEEKNCPCCSGQPYGNCCLPLLNKTKTAGFPEQLMRSRYTAFYIGDVNYLLETSSLALKQKLTKDDLLDTVNSCAFINLEIVYADTDTVEFKADYIVDNKHEQIHEKSLFVQESGFWKYDSGEHFPSFSQLIKRNDPCPCGSGKKFKKCHQA